MKNRKKAPKTRVRSTAKRPPKKRRGAKSRPIHKRIFLHPITVLLLLCIGVLLIGLTFHAYGDSYSVTAKVLAPLPTVSATITSPADQAHFTSRPIMVEGTCPQNTYVELLRNNVFSGVALCGAGQTTFQIETDLFLGSNTLFVQVFNVTDQAGPRSPSITVFYNLSNSPASTSTTNPAVSQSPFFITYDFQYQQRVSGQPFSLDLSLSGGVSPFAMTVLWGDGKESTILRNDRSKFSVQHTYKLPNENKQLYRVKIEAVDNQGATAFLDIPELVHGSAGIPLIGSLNNNNLFTRWIWLAWPTYLMVVLMVLSFWLGERQEDYYIFSGKGLRRRRA